MVKTSICVRGSSYDNATDMKLGGDQFRRGIFRTIDNVQWVSSLKRVFESVVEDTRSELLEQISARSNLFGLRDYDHSSESYHISIKHSVEGENIKIITYDFYVSNSFTNVSKYRYSGERPPSTRYSLNQASGVGFLANDDGHPVKYNTKYFQNSSSLDVRLDFQEKNSGSRGRRLTARAHVCGEDVIRAFNMRAKIYSSEFSDRLRMIAEISDASQPKLKTFEAAVCTLR